MTTSSSTERAGAPPAGSVHVVDGTAVVYRLYDVGYEIQLDRALELLAASYPERVRPVRGEAQTIQIKNTPITVLLGAETAIVGDRRIDGEMSARIFDFGVVSLRLRLPAPPQLGWSDFSDFGSRIDLGLDLTPRFQQQLQQLLERVGPAIVRPTVAPVAEDYIVFRITRLVDALGRELPTDTLRDEDVLPLLLNETRPLSAAARRDVLPNRYSYYTDDLAILTWDNALVVEPAPSDTDIQYIVEFANAQLLELRVYDAALDAELTRMYDRVAAARAGRMGPLGRRYTPILADLQTLVADSTELVERVENALKVTDDVYLARVYTGALELFRGRAWRGGIDRKLGIMRETYAMLNAESQARRSEALEIIIILLIAIELVIALLVR